MLPGYALAVMGPQEAECSDRASWLERWFGPLERDDEDRLDRERSSGAEVLGVEVRSLSSVSGEEWLSLKSLPDSYESLKHSSDLIDLYLCSAVLRTRS